MSCKVILVFVMARSVLYESWDILMSVIAASVLESHGISVFVITDFSDVQAAEYSNACNE